MTALDRLEVEEYENVEALQTTNIQDVDQADVSGDTNTHDVDQGDEGKATILGSVKRPNSDATSNDASRYTAADVGMVILISVVDF